MAPPSLGRWAWRTELNLQGKRIIGPWAFAWNRPLMLQGLQTGLRAGSEAPYCLGWRGGQGGDMGGWGGSRSWNRIAG